MPSGSVQDGRHPVQGSGQAIQVGEFLLVGIPSPVAHAAHGKPRVPEIASQASQQRAQVRQVAPSSPEKR